MGYIIRSALNEGDVAAILRSPEVNRFLGDWGAEDLCVARLSEKTFQVTGSKGGYILRFPPDDEELARLKKEERVQKSLRVKVHLQIPATQVLEIEGYPVFAIHPLIPGQPLTSEIYECLSPEAHNRLIMDLATFFYETHRIPLALACDWLDIHHQEALAELYGKPLWFGGEASAVVRASLVTVLNTQEMKLFEEVVNFFDALPVEPGYMVFGHGDLHGYNMAMSEDALGPKMTGVFDLGCTGILDIHEDFFRLSLISEDLLERVIEKYQEITNQVRTLRRDRIAIYYRAFLFYLMSEIPRENHDHLKKMLQRHIQYYHETYGPISG